MSERAGVYVGRILEGAKSGRFAGRAADQILSGPQTRNRESIRLDRVAEPARACWRGDRMRRRDFLTVLCGASAASTLSPLLARAGRLRRVAVLMSLYRSTDQEGIASADAFADTLHKLGWTEGDNMRIDYRWDAGNPAGIKASAAEVVNSQPDVIVAATNPAVAELQRLTQKIPIVFTRVANPVGSGFATSLARPGGNITGFQASDSGLGGKWVELSAGVRSRYNQDRHRLWLRLHRRCSLSASGGDGGKINSRIIGGHRYSRRYSA